MVDPLCAGQLHILSFLPAHQVTRIQSVHDKSLIYRDIKPDNFLIGVPGTKNANVIHLIGMSMALHLGFFLPLSGQRTMEVRAYAPTCTLQLVFPLTASQEGKKPALTRDTRADHHVPFMCLAKVGEVILTYDFHPFAQISAWRSTIVIRRPRFTYHIVNASPYPELRDICLSIPTLAASNHDVMTSSL